ncbi:hypothetical protein CEXT_124791 [Caerostris extrusa]|uniref:Uncharacterized protein n=1 Tax=Caerostris extrusa TaxID=172846 RepID=A0AAV4QSI9_CAEEX|nr:hypothetical protein CEXT_124791 [Caerostris extrusa]
MNLNANIEEKKAYNLVYENEVSGPFLESMENNEMTTFIKENYRIREDLEDLGRSKERSESNGGGEGKVLSWSLWSTTGCSAKDGELMMN